MAISNLTTGLRPGVCTSLTRPTTPYEGQVIYETDTDKTLVWNGSAWLFLSTPQATEIGGPSETFTPVWSSTGTQPDIGNGTLTGRYFKIQKIVIMQIALVCGSTTTYGTGSYRFSIPFVARTGIYSSMPNGVARMFNAAVAETFLGQSGFTSNQTDRIAVFLSGSVALAGITQPFTWSNSAQLQLSFQYEAA